MEWNSTRTRLTPLVHFSLFPSDLLCYSATTVAGASPNAAFVSGGTCTAAAPPVYGSSNWKSANLCLLDSSANRVLVGNFIQTSSNSIEYCTSLCTSLQYNYAGLESEYWDTNSGERALTSTRLLFSFFRWKSVSSSSSCRQGTISKYTSLLLDATAATPSLKELDMAPFEPPRRGKSTLYPISSSFRADPTALFLISVPYHVLPTPLRSVEAPTTVWDCTTTRRESQLQPSDPPLPPFPRRHLPPRRESLSTFQLVNLTRSNLYILLFPRSSSRMSTSVSSSSSSASETSTTSSQSSSTSTSATPTTSTLPSSNGYTSLGCVQDVSSYVLQDYGLFFFISLLLVFWRARI